MKRRRGILTVAALMALFAVPVFAAGISPEQKLQACLKKAEDLPDDAAATAQVWEKQGGGNRALLCEAEAQLHRGEFATAAKEFSTLAAAQQKNNRNRAASFYAQAGLAYAQANDGKNAEAQYALALKLEPQDPDIWLDRATARAGAERYWDAVDDINKALGIMPDMPEALRLRGQVWMKLGLDSKARDDFAQAEDAEAQDQDIGKPKTAQKTTPLPATLSGKKP
jgi:tetratricopeptide (TPR) repeat protein